MCYLSLRLGPRILRKRAGRFRRTGVRVMRLPIPGQLERRVGPGGGQYTKCDVPAALTEQILRLECPWLLGSRQTPYVGLSRTLDLH